MTETLNESREALERLAETELPCAWVAEAMLETDGANARE